MAPAIFAPLGLLSSFSSFLHKHLSQSHLAAKRHPALAPAWQGFSSCCPARTFPTHFILHIFPIIFLHETPLPKHLSAKRHPAFAPLGLFETWDSIPVPAHSTSAIPPPNMAPAIFAPLGLLSSFSSFLHKHLSQNTHPPNATRHLPPPAGLFHLPTRFCYFAFILLPEHIPQPFCHQTHLVRLPRQGFPHPC